MIVPRGLPLSLDHETVTLKPGDKVKVILTLDSLGAEPGTYAGGVWIKETPTSFFPST